MLSQETRSIRDKLQRCVRAATPEARDFRQEWRDYELKNRIAHVTYRTEQGL